MNFCIICFNKWLYELPTRNTKNCVEEVFAGTVKGKTRISKKGNARIRSALYMPALSMIREKNQPLFSLYLRVVKRNPKIKKKAIVAVQRKLLILIFVLWKKNQPFDPKYQWNKQATAKKEVALA